MDAHGADHLGRRLDGTPGSERMAPTRHVFVMYNVHQDATLPPLDLQ